MCLTRAGDSMETELARITQRAREHPEEKFNSLMGRVFNLEKLHESFQAQSRKKAPGIDGVRKDDYAVGVDDKLRELSDRVRRMGYRPAAVRRACATRRIAATW